MQRVSVSSDTRNFGIHKMKCDTEFIVIKCGRRMQRTPMTYIVQRKYKMNTFEQYFRINFNYDRSGYVGVYVHGMGSGFR